MAMIEMTLNGQGQGHSFWYQSIPNIRLPTGCQQLTFSLGRTVYQNTYVTDDRRSEWTWTDATL